MTTGGVVLGVDVGGTGIKARVTDASGRSLGDHRVPTPKDDPHAHRLAEVVADLVVGALRTPAPGPDHTLDAVGLVVPGVVHEASGTAVLSVNLGWRGVPVRDRVQQALEHRGITVPVAFGHDVRAGALAEVSGPGAAALRVGSVGFVPVGTGLASALVVDGAVVDGGGWAGEVGQVRITVGPHAGARTEEIASAGAVARRLGVPSARQAVERVRAGDPAAVAVWHECIDVLADAIAWMTAVAGCHTVVVGGGLAESGALLFGPLGSAVADRLPGLRAPALVPARHRDAAGSLGAAILAQDLLASLTSTGQRA
ncbi:ROK family protein [Curtobacterium sp. MCBA15_001]|uniref:ROK family protein n=1 Tax=Curtobacterium sp. MCBA15_001 TaxID=1898731 RepID=UPI0008DE85D9|nr:ROK family protein [Curtobacterium sp. MCBA15_001]OIH95480.1 hypothetical protein BIU90_01915 [Curtobacterium sp. MCBA15_001]